MYKFYKSVQIVILAILTAGCGNSSRESTGMGLQSVLWYQHAAEVEALYLQGYNMASDILKKIDTSEFQKTPAIVLDIDETVLDNSPFNADMLLKGFTFSSERWAAWCELRQAEALPGALDFTQLADSLGFAIFYISNRDHNLLEATIDNLKAEGFPGADSTHVLLKHETSSKIDRRNQVLSEHSILLLLGDNLGDFDGIFEERDDDFGKSSVREEGKYFGARYIIFPNPMYGDWERALFPGGKPDQKTAEKKLRGSS